MKQYLDDKDAYLQRFDAVVRSAEKHGIGLIPSLFWNTCTIPDLAGEPLDQWGNPDSKTMQLMRTYVKDIVTRYRNSPAIWGWEFGNEYNLSADLPNASEVRPPVKKELGNPSTRSARDDMTHDMTRVAFAEFATEVRKYDPYRIIESGNSEPRPSAWHQRKEHSWTLDTSDQWSQMIIEDAPDPLNMVSIHAYVKDDFDRLPIVVAAAKRIHNPVFIGEFGVKGPASAASQKEFSDMVSTIEKSKVQLAALWVFDHGKDDAYTVTGANDRAYQLKAISEANSRIREQLAK
jgi:hypothetical protein